MKKILILGYFGFITNQLDGQTIKTREILGLLQKKSTYSVNYFDTQSFKTRPFSIVQLLKMVNESDIIIYLPGQRNLKWVYPIIRNFIKKRTKIIYLVVGGWLDEFLRTNHSYIKYLKKYNLIGVETQRLKNILEAEFNLKNVDIITNFRTQEYKPYENVPKDFLRVVFMARITETKGCNIIFKLADKLIAEGRDNIKFKFYGKIDPAYESDFKRNLHRTKMICSYGGVIQPNDVYSILNANDILILPTFYEGEGFPGSIIDAYKSGIPVLISNWKDLPEFVIVDKTGYIFEPNDINGFYNALIELSSNNDKLSDLKKNAFHVSKKYSPESAWNIIAKYIRD